MRKKYETHWENTPVRKFMGVELSYCNAVVRFHSVSELLLGCQGSQLQLLFQTKEERKGEILEGFLSGEKKKNISPAKF